MDELLSLAPAGPRESLAERGATIESSWSDGERRDLLTAEPFARYSLDEADVPVLEHEARVRALVAGQQHPDVPGDAGELIRAEEASALHDAGMELGSHTLSHPDLHTLDDAELEHELVGSKQAIEELTGEPCRTLAYPCGIYDERVVRAAGEAGYELAFGWLPGAWRRLEAPRLPAPPRHGAHRLSLKLLGIRRPGR